MKTKTVKRYYCDHCGKGGMRSDCIARHERVCFRNPMRGCLTCDGPDALNPRPVAGLVTILRETGDAQKTKAAADGCPSCVMAAILQLRPKGKGIDRDEWIDFNYKAELEEYNLPKMPE